MSVVRSCIRLATVAALRETTWAETRVYDSDFSPLDEAVTLAPAPYVVVFTESDSRSDLDGSAPFTGNRSISLVIDMGLASKATLTREEAGATVQIPVIQIPQTDASLELALDQLEQQVLDALFGETQGVWGELWRRMVMKTQAISSQRGASAESGSRIAARQMLIVVDPIADPVPGVPLVGGSPILDFLTSARDITDARISGAVAAIMQTLPRTARPTWRQAQAQLGMTEKAARTLDITGNE